MKRLDSEIVNFLRRDAKMVKDARVQARKAKEIYKPEVASEIILKEINSIKGLRENYKKSINRLVEVGIKEIREAHENQYRSEGHQATISNILKMLELRNFDVSEKQFKNLVAQLIKADD